MWTIHQPKPRTASPHTFPFLNDPPEKPQKTQLPTPSSTPEPKPPPIRRLSIPDLVSTDEHFGKINTLQMAVDTFERAALPGDAVLMFDQTGEGEYLLSARPWEVDACRQVSQELWDRLEGHTRVPATAPVHAPTVQPTALSYLTPPSSPEPVRRRDIAPIEHSEPLNVPEPTISSDCANVPADPYENESLEYLSDYDDEDEWAVESGCSDTEELPAACAPGLIKRTDCLTEDGLHTNPKRPISPTALPSNACDLSLENSTMCLSTNSVVISSGSNIRDLTPHLDEDRFSEWPIARGGFGEIWKGALTQGRPIAVKRLTMYSAAGDDGAKKIGKRTDREMTIWSSLKHPNILPLMGICSFRGSMGLVSEWQENGNATEWVRANPSVDRLDLCKGICAGLKYLHESGIVHGDLRGGNVMISKAGAPRLIDFGLASITDGNPFSASSTLAGTLRWMAPELQVTEGQGTTKAGDMFAFGMTMLELFTGSPPFLTVKNDIAVLLKYQNGERPPRPSPTRSIKSSKNNRAETRPTMPRGRGEARDVCVPMDDETWCQVQECWDQDPSQRPSVNEMLEWWFMWKRKRRLDVLD